MENDHRCLDLKTPLSGGANEPVEQPAERARGAEVFRVPLHTDAERVALVGFERFGHAVAGSRGDVEAGSDCLTDGGAC